MADGPDAQNGETLAQELIAAATDAGWQDRYRALERAYELPRDLRQRVARAFVADRNVWVSGLAAYLSEEARPVLRRSRRGVLHDLNQIIAGAKLNFEQRAALIQLYEGAEQAGSLAYLGLAADRAARLVTGGLSSSEDGRNRYLYELERFLRHIGAFAQPLAIRDTVEPLSAVLSKVGRSEELRFTLENEAELRAVKINRDVARGVLDELLANAVDSGATQASLQASTSNGHVSIRVSNNGPAIEPGVGERLFEPWYTTRTGHAGLGLYLAREMLREAGGTIRPLDLSNSEFEVVLPRA